MQAIAKLNNYPTSPMKMRLLADEIRTKKIDWALNFLEHHPMPGAIPMKKLLLSAIANWRVKNNNQEEENLLVKIIYVDGGPVLKRMLPAPQGRAHRKKKRSNHITIIVDAVEA